jgi:hypothetical protein
VPGLIAAVSDNEIDQQTADRLTETINFFQNCELRSTRAGASLFIVGSLKDTPLKGRRLFEDGRWIVSFCGDMIEYKEVPHERIIGYLESGMIQSFSKFNGIFAIVAYDKRAQRLYVISDRRSQHPLYFLTGRDGLFVSTDLSAFCRFKKELRFNENWLWEYLFFNYPIGASTFLSGVKRMPPATVLEYDSASGKSSKRVYAERFRKKERLLDGTQSLDLAVRIFADRIPKYFEGAEEIACALTGGWDGRTMLALAPEKDITAYTYGVPGCDDLTGAGESARLADIKHVAIHFDEEFTSDLPHRMLETVYSSSGLQGILRATGPYAYGRLTDSGRRFPLTVSGTSLDMQFRGHACAPSLISEDTVSLFERGKTVLRRDFWSEVIKSDYDSFEGYIHEKLDSLRNSFGDFRSTDHHLSYIIYVLSTQYFCGEFRMADNFTTVRVPSWDSEIIDLSFSIAKSTLSFSEFSEYTRGGIDEMVLQSYLLSKLSPRFARIPIRNTRPDIILKGNTMHQIYRIYKGGMRWIARGLRRAGAIPLEDWDKWINDLHRPFVDRLIFSKDSRIRQYIKDDYLRQLRSHRLTHYIGKLASVEVILRLVETSWKRFW